ncbi:MAG: alpha/beta hydrolase [Rhodobacterales bacterium]|jgi:lysophospholipase|tara:strand:- start:949 stop:1896 length:948 start_codon:yes stop_codon:yes gene_type:complete
MLSPAPLYNDLAVGPTNGTGHWVTGQDGVRIRIGVWNSGAKGTVLIFPGRTEYIEKYGGAARELSRHGYSSVAVDWRGQGLADRLQLDRNIGHVINFTDYQYDVQAMLRAADTLGLHKPYYLVAHSMGGCIALRALMQKMPVQASSFSAPMWGIAFHPPVKRVMAWGLSTLAHPFALSETRAPGTSITAYVTTEPFATNSLTCDAPMFAQMKAHLEAVPDWALGGPSLRWLNEALREMRHLHNRPSPDYPALCYLGSEENIVDPRRIHSRMARWPRGRLETMAQAKHEIMMERPEHRDVFYAQTSAFFDAHQPMA